MGEEEGGRGREPCDDEEKIKRTAIEKEKDREENK